ncbi:MAG: M10 family metallopeptidase C-terminal domain-containing protein, partial [Proteobacteria bacterium]|nr:M10 family metallopeptidase C-terminal domain-containing protein [Pseudomonadota bacterium]
MTTPTYEDEVAFLSKVDAAGTVAAISYGNWLPTLPITYYPTESDALKWGSGTPGTGASVKYLFEVSSGWSAVEKAAWNGGFALWSAVANIALSVTTDPAEANIVVKRGSDGNAFASFPTHDAPLVGAAVLTSVPVTGSLVSIDTNASGFGPIGSDITAANGYPLSTVVHEIGHILGLGHGGPYNSTVDMMNQQFSAYDTLPWTLMSYIRAESTATKYFNDYPVKNTFWNNQEPMTPMMLDILAIQRLYGPATSGPLAGGGQVFGFNANIAGYIGRFYDFGINTRPIVTLWDGGKNNTLDLSGFTDDSNVSLVPGTFSSVAGYVNNVAVAFNTVIEKAIGGTGNDTIYASDVASTLVGGLGNDHLYGGDGDDIISGGPGADRIDGGSGHNTLRDTLADMDGDTIVNMGTR